MGYGTKGVFLKWCVITNERFFSTLPLSEIFSLMGQSGQTLTHPKQDTFLMYIVGFRHRISFILCASLRSASSVDVRRLSIRSNFISST